MAGVDSSIDNVNCCSASSRRVVDISGRVLVPVGDSTKTVSCSGLRGESIGVDFGVFLDVHNL